MAILLQCPADRIERWRAALRDSVDPDVRVWPNYGDAAAIEAMVVTNPVAGSHNVFPNLRFIAATGAGVDRLCDPSIALPPGLPLTRVVDETLTRSMAEYVLTAVMMLHRGFAQFAAAQRERRWAPLPRVDPKDRTIGILGLGILGTAAAALLQQIGFRVFGWARSLKDVPGVEAFEGEKGFAEMLARVDIMVNLLPLTPETARLLDARCFSAMRRGSSLINVGRGRHIVEADLRAALDSGQIAHAILDVFEYEPLDAAHWAWSHAQVTATPHIASLTVPETAVIGIAQNLLRARSGQPLLYRIDRLRGY